MLQIDDPSRPLIPGKTRVRVLVGDIKVPGTFHGITTDHAQALVGLSRNTTDSSLWPSFSPGNGKCVFKLFPIGSIDYDDRIVPGKTPTTPVEESSDDSTYQPDGPVRIPEGDIWRSNRGKHERFEIVEDVYDGQVVKLLCLDTPGYKRETAFDKFFKFYYRDEADNAGTSSLKTILNTE